MLSAARRFVLQIPDSRLDESIPHRPRSYRQLAFHTFEIYQFFVDFAEAGRPLSLADYANEIVPPYIQTAAHLERFAGALQDRFVNWWQRAGKLEDFSRKADVYYGEQTLHEFLERTVWHSGQHTRQIQFIVEKLGLMPDGALSAADVAGLPMPTNVFDDQLKFD
jgi:hypothetical protein